jgi:hypothetical protein
MPVLTGAPQWRCALDLFGTHISEPDVAFTDFVLAIECLIIAIWLFIKCSPRTVGVFKWYLVFYLSIVVASIAGGITHGFFNSPGGVAHNVLWCSTLVAIGGNALASWNLAPQLLNLRERSKKLIFYLSTIYFVFYAIYVTATVPRFVVAVIDYLPATLFLLYAAWRVYRQFKIRYAVYGLIALVMTVLAAVIQQSRIGLHSTFFNHNALYHLIQGVALVFFANYARWTTSVIHDNSAGSVS